MSSKFISLTIRNMKLYFKDKSNFLVSLISPMILFVLFVTFLGSVYEQSLTTMLPQGVTLSKEIIKSFTSGWLLSSILGVSSVTVAFCSNIIMAQDRVRGAVNDISVTPVKKSTIALSYFSANFISTLIICLTIMVIGFIYMAFVGWFFSFLDIVLIILDIILGVLLGTALATLVGFFIKSEGGITAISTLVSALYGFICGAYMPLSQFSKGVRNFVSFMPGTYQVAIFRNHYMNGVINEMSKILPAEVISSISDVFDVNSHFFEQSIELWQCYLIVGTTIVFLLSVFILINKKRLAKKSN